MKLPQFRISRFLGIGAALLVVLLLGGGIYWRLNSSEESEDGSGVASEVEGIATSASSAFGTDVAIPVEGAPVVRDTLVLGVTAAGEAEAWQRSIVTAQVGGRLVRMPVRENTPVGAGQTVAALDPGEYQLAVEEAEAAVRDAQAKFDEMTLFDDRIQDAATREQRERVARAKSGLDAAGVRLRRAQLDLTRARLGAPFAGRVADIQVTPGQWIAAGEELMTVVDLNPIKVEVQVLEREIGYLSSGGRALVTFAAFPDLSFPGRIETINPVVESGTRTARVTVLIPNAEGRILPGMYARVSLDARRFPNRVLVPRAAVLERDVDRRKMLFVFEGDDSGGRAKWRYVTTGLANDSLVEIVPSEETDSVRPGETVLIDGHYTLTHDARVRLVQNVASEGGRPQ